MNHLLEATTTHSILCVLLYISQNSMTHFMEKDHLKTAVPLREDSLLIFFFTIAPKITLQLLLNAQMLCNNEKTKG